jgi:hypothetical protein
MITMAHNMNTVIGRRMDSRGTLIPDLQSAGGAIPPHEFLTAGVD